MQCVKLSVLLLIPQSLCQGIFIPILQMRKMADCVGRGEVRIQIWGLFPLYHQARERLRTNPAPILVSRIYVCW